VVEVSLGRYLFAVVDDNRPDEQRLFYPNDGRAFDDPRNLRAVKGRPIEVPPDHYPLMVTFVALQAPSSVKEVNPADLPATFGEGYRIKSYTVEITDEPMTDGRIEALLPWLDPTEGSSLCEPKSLEDFSFCASKIYHWNFLRG
jgi:hypothetical protein